MRRWVGGVVGAGVTAVVLACGSISLEAGGALGDVTYSGDVQPILLTRCSPCHANEAFGGTNFAVSYGDMFIASQRCPDLPVYRCIQELVTTGVMPPNVGCTGDPAVDASNDACLTAGELTLLETWAAEGAPE